MSTLENWSPLVKGNIDTGEIVIGNQEFDQEYDGPDYRRGDNQPFYQGLEVDTQGV